MFVKSWIHPGIPWSSILASSTRTSRDSMVRLVNGSPLNPMIICAMPAPYKRYSLRRRGICFIHVLDKSKEHDTARRLFQTAPLRRETKTSPAFGLCPALSCGHRTILLSIGTRPTALFVVVENVTVAVCEKVSHARRRAGRRSRGRTVRRELR